MESSEDSVQQLRNKIEDQLSYLNKIKDRYEYQEARRIYEKLNNVLLELRFGKMIAPSAISKITKLFRSDLTMVVDFKAFLPSGIEIGTEIDSIKQEPRIFFKQINFQPTRLDEELKDIDVKTNDFVTEVQHCYSNSDQNSEFEKFLRILDRYRIQKSIVSEKPNAEVELESQLTELFKDQAYLLGKFKQLRIPDYLCIISFNYALMCGLQNDFFVSAKREQLTVFLNKVWERFKNEPEVWNRFTGFISTYAKKNWDEERYCKKELDSELAEILQGQEDLLKILESFYT